MSESLDLGRGRAWMLLGLLLGLLVLTPALSASGSMPSDVKTKKLQATADLDTSDPHSLATISVDRHDVLPANRGSEGDRSQLIKWLPGVQRFTTEEIREFNSSLLAGIYAGIVSGVVTGVIVGAVVLCFEKRVERRQHLNGLRREFAIFKEDLRYNVDKPTIFGIDAPETIPESIKSISELLKKSPIDIWHELLPQQRGFIRALKEFQVNLHAYSNAGSRLDQRLSVAVRKNEQSHGVFSAMGPTKYVYFMGRSLGFQDDDIAPFLEFGVANGVVSGAVRSSYQELSADGELQELASEYKNKKETLTDSIGTIRQLLGMEHGGGE